MDKRVVIFLVLSLAIILGFDLFLKQMGWLPELPPAQDGAVTSSSAEREPAPALETSQNSSTTSLSVPTQSGQKSTAPSSDILPATSEKSLATQNLVKR